MTLRAHSTPPGLWHPVHSVHSEGSPSQREFGLLRDFAPSSPKRGIQCLCWTCPLRALDLLPSLTPRTKKLHVCSALRPDSGGSDLVRWNRPRMVLATVVFSLRQSKPQCEACALPRGRNPLVALVPPGRPTAVTPNAVRDGPRNARKRAIGTSGSWAGKRCCSGSLVSIV